MPKGDFNSIKKEVSNNLKKKDKIENDRILIDNLTAEVLNNRFNNGNHFIQDKNENTFIYSEGYWKVVSDSALRKLIYEHCKGLDVFVIVEDKVKLIEKIKDFMRVQSSKDFDLYEKSFSSGIINVSNGQLKVTKKGVSFSEHNYKDYLTSKINVEYNPKATKSEMFFNFLDRICPNKEEANSFKIFVSQMYGLTLMSDSEYSKVFHLYGQGGTGKSSLARIIQNFIGEEYCSDINCSVKGNKDLGRMGEALLNKYMAIDHDVEVNTVLPDGLLKKLSDGKYSTIDPKFKKPFRAKLFATPYLISNGKLYIKDLSNGIKRRLVVVPFYNPLKEEEYITNIEDKIVDKDGSFILNFILKGLMLLKQTNKLNVPKYIQDFTKEILEENNIPLEVFKEKLEKTGKENDRVSFTDFFAIYLLHCEENKSRSMSRNKFFETVRQTEELQPYIKHTGNRYFICGHLSLHSVEEIKGTEGFNK